MRKDLADITLVVDRSGSMDSIREDAEGGINAFIQQQAELEGQALITLVQFDTDYEFVVKGKLAEGVEPYRLVPRGMTALLDAVGRAINETGERLAKMPAEARPGLVVFVVMTDGLENSSVEFTKQQIREMIQHQQSAYNWQFTFLGADQDAFAEAADIGIAAGGAATFAKPKARKAYKHTGNKVARMRAQTFASQPVENRFSKFEQEDMS